MKSSFHSPFGEIEVYSKRALPEDAGLRKSLGPLSIALGFFDGVHLGHQQLIRKTLKTAAENGSHSAVLTFLSHPLTEIFPRYAPFLLMTNEEKARKILKMGVDYVIFLPFTDRVRKLSPRAFLKDLLLDEFDTRALIAGYNYSFGYKGEGKAEDLKRFGKAFGFQVFIEKSYLHHGQAVSSTIIRELLGTGDVAKAGELLGEAYQLEGPVQSGKHLGRQYKIPTANLKLTREKLLPKSGVYFTHLWVDGVRYDGLTNLGFNPTFEKHPYAVETYIYDFDEDIYGKDIRLEFVDRIRGDMKFESVDALFRQIHSDIIKVNMLYRSKK